MRLDLTPGNWFPPIPCRGTRGGQEIDCIDFFAQHGVKELVAKGEQVSIPQPPSIPAQIQSLMARSGVSAEPRDVPVGFAGDLDENGNVRSCPDGSVPQVRITVEQVQRAGGIDAFRQQVHQKAHRPRPHRRRQRPARKEVTIVGFPKTRVMPTSSTG